MLSLTAQALWLEPPRGAALRRETLAVPGPGDLTVRTRFSAVSRGTEALVYAGRVPASERTRMRAPFQQGHLPGPVKHGYANVGVVESGPEDWVGCTVFCLFPHQTRYVIPATAAIPVPDDVPPARAVLAANMETALNALWDAAPRIGDRISVVGAGVIGCLTARLCARLPGVDVQLVDIDAEKAGAAVALGVGFTAPETARTERDLVFHASATGAGLDTALSLAGTEADIIEMSWFGDRSPAVSLGGAFHSRRLTLRASQVGTVAPARAARWDHGRRLALALALCADARLDALFAADAEFWSLPEVMARLADPGDHTLCQRIVYPENGACIT